LEIAELTQRLADLYAAGQTYPFVQQAHRVLACVPEAPELARLTLRALVELGLGGPARELLQLRRDLTGASGATRAGADAEGAGLADADLAELHAAITSLPNGRVAWTELDGMLAANHEALLRHRPHLRALAASLERIRSGVHLYRTRDGLLRISRRQPGQLRKWMPDLNAAGDQPGLNLPGRGRLGPVAVVGLPLGTWLTRIYDDTANVFLQHSHPLYLLEPDPVRFCAWLHGADHRRLLDDERVYVLVGPDAAEQLHTILIDEPQLALPSVFVQCGENPAAAAAVREKVARIARARQVEMTRWTEQLARRYRNRDAVYWMERLRLDGGSTAHRAVAHSRARTRGQHGHASVDHATPPSTGGIPTPSVTGVGMVRPACKGTGPVLGITSRFTTVLQYSTRDALHAFEELGYTTLLLIEEKDHHCLSPLTIARAVLEHDPALVLLLDHLRYEHPYLPKNLPLLTWIQDPLPNLLCERAGQSIGALDFVCGHYFDQCTQRYGYPDRQFVPAELPVSTRVMHDAELDEDSVSREACDISFVSNASTPIDRFYETTKGQYPPALHPLLETIYGRVCEVLESGGYLSFHRTAAELVRTAARQMGIALPDGQVEQLKTAFAYRLFDWGRRQQTLEWVADWARRTGRVLRIYGRGWENHPRLTDFAAGVVEHGEPLRRANRGSKLGLQLIPSGFRHQRSYEMLVCGCLPLTRYCPPDFLELSDEEFQARRRAGDELPCAAGIFPGLERIVFRTPQEFEALAERFLVDDAYRRQVRDELRRVVLQRCTYTDVVGQVMQVVGNELARRLDAIASVAACST